MQQRFTFEGLQCIQDVVYMYSVCSVHCCHDNYCIFVMFMAYSSQGLSRQGYGAHGELMCKSK